MLTTVVLTSAGVARTGDSEHFEEKLSPAQNVRRVSCHFIYFIVYLKAKLHAESLFGGRT